MANPIYIMFDVDCDVKLMDHEPTIEEAFGWYDGRFIKVENGKVYASFVDEESENKATFEWREVTNDSD